MVTDDVLIAGDGVSPPQVCLAWLVLQLALEMHQAKYFQNVDALVVSLC